MQYKCATCKYWGHNGYCEELTNYLEVEVDDPYCGYTIHTDEDFYCNLYEIKEDTNEKSRLQQNIIFTLKQLCS